VLNRAGSTDPKAIQKACNEIDIRGYELVMPWDGIKFDATGQNIKGRGLIGQYQWKEGKRNSKSSIPLILHSQYDLSLPGMEIIDREKEFGVPISFSL